MNCHAIYQESNNVHGGRPQSSKMRSIWILRSIDREEDKIVPRRQAIHRRAQCPCCSPRALKGDLSSPPSQYHLDLRLCLLPVTGDDNLSECCCGPESAFSKSFKADFSSRSIKYSEKASLQTGKVEDSFKFRVSFALAHVIVCRDHRICPDERIS